LAPDLLKLVSSYEQAGYGYLERNEGAEAKKALLLLGSEGHSTIVFSPPCEGLSSPLRQSQ